MKKILVLTSALLFALIAYGQQYKGIPVPVDSAYRIGKLPNGLTYYIRHNSEPEKRASFFIIQNVGAILEEDNQQGLAHFLEHMAFNGTTHFPDKAIINSLEKHGVAFGRNINASTSLNQTVYNISNVPAEDPGLIDTCLTILADWSHFITLSDEEIDKERGVIVEEWRTGMSAGRRMQEKRMKFKYEGSKYAMRNVIGDTIVLKAFPYDALRSFYNDWYRPDLQAIAIVGDIDVDATEAKIKSIFSSIPASENSRPRPRILVPPHKGTRFMSITDPEASGTTISFSILDTEIDTLYEDKEYARRILTISIMNAMLNNRINELLQKGNPPFIYGSISYSMDMARDYRGISAYVSVQKNQETAAFEALITEIERARRYGFTQGELDRAIATALSNYENYYKQQNKITNDEHIRNVVNSFLLESPLLSVSYNYELRKEIFAGIKLAELSDIFKSLIKEDNRVITIEGLEGVGITHLSESETFAIIDKIKLADIQPYEDFVSATPLVSEKLTGSKVIKTTPFPQFSAKEWILSNGAKVVYRYADYEKDNVEFYAYAWGGESMYPDSLVPSASLFSPIVSMYGAGEFDNITLGKMLSGKIASVSLGLSETMQTIRGKCSPKDFETMMQLLYLRFARPNFNKEAYDAVLSRYNSMVINSQKNPSQIMSDSISMNLTGYHPRSFILNPESMKKITFEDVNYIYSTAFDNASRFTFFIVGNIEEDQAKAMAEKYIGSLPVKEENENWIDRGIRQPKGLVTKEIKLPLEVPKGTVFTNYSTELDYNPRNYLSLTVLGGILNIIYVDKVREEKSGTYGVRVYPSAQSKPINEFSLGINFDCEPGRAEELKAVIYSELKKIASEGPTQVDLDKTVSNQLKQREENIPHNSYWNSILITYYTNGIDSNDENNFQNILKSFTTEDIKNFTKEFLSTSDQLEIVFLPEKK